MDKESKHSFQRSTASSARSASKPIRTTASYMHASKAEPVEENSRRSKKAGRSRRRGRNENVQKKAFPWKVVGISAGVLVIVLVALLLILGSDPKVYHQMPKVTPPETVESAEVSA